MKMYPSDIKFVCEGYRSPTDLPTLQLYPTREKMPVGIRGTVYGHVQENFIGLNKA